MTNDRLAMRASDHDRQEAVDQLRAALEDGRLTMEEYVERMGLAYQAVTYGDLVPLQADLPAAGLMTHERRPRVPAPAPRAVACPRGALASLPMALKVLWAIWLTAVSVNVMVWVLVSSTGHLAYPWPLWVAGPYGAVLAAVTACVQMFRRAPAAAP